VVVAAWYIAAADPVEVAERVAARLDVAVRTLFESAVDDVDAEQHSKSQVVATAGALRN
jgi:hypothetical protein